jgi:16S rRNA (adenine1518-N6/adenine1519-N6)-dimethyltransferase
MIELKLTSPRVVRHLLRERGIRPRKRWGQHFLCDGNVLEKIVASAQLAPQDRVLEIGAGLGVLTERIASSAREVIAVEIDPLLIPLLQEQVSAHPNVRIVHADVLELDWRTLFRSSEKFRVMGNLPYGITSPLLEKLIHHRDLFHDALVMVQLEVAEKLKAAAGTRECSSLGIFVQAYCDVDYITRVSRNVFFPRPEVDSALVRLIFLRKPRFQASEESFMAVIHAGFGLRRKTLQRALALSPELRLTPEQVHKLLQASGIDGSRRGETLTVEEWDRLAQALDALSHRRL